MGKRGNDKLGTKHKQSEESNIVPDAEHTLPDQWMLIEPTYGLIGRDLVLRGLAQVTPPRFEHSQTTFLGLQPFVWFEMFPNKRQT